MRIIAEVGQNHQGDVKIALDYIQKFSDIGATAIKFQKRSLENLFDYKTGQREYENPNSFGKTYIEHRKQLELTIEEMKQLKDKCDQLKVEFICTPFDKESARELGEINCKIFKLASFDLGNVNLINYISDLCDEVIFSTGGGRKEHVHATVEAMRNAGINDPKITLLHCVSEYPTNSSHLKLKMIEYWKTRYPNINVGLSDHYPGVLTGALGYSQGARTFEKHVTFNRAWKGTDHAFALEPIGFEKYSRDLRIAEEALSSSEVEKDSCGNEPVFQKLGKTIYATKMIEQDELLTTENIDSMIKYDGVMPVRDTYKILGNVAIRKIQKNESIANEMLKDE